MDAPSAFRPGGPQLVIQAQSSVAAGSAAATLCSTRPTGDISYLIFNSDRVDDVFVGFGATAAQAQAAAQVPVAGTPGVVSCLAIPAGTMQTFTLTSNLYFAAAMVAASGQNATASVFIVSGDGV